MDLNDFRNDRSVSRVIVSVVCHPIHVLEAALAGADVATIHYEVIEQLVQHPLTDIALEKFSVDWKKFLRK